MNVTKMCCAKTWITVAVLHTKKHVLQIPPQKRLTKIQTPYISTHCNYFKPIKCNHATFLHSIANLKQLNCTHTTFLHAITDLNQLNCKHNTFLHSTTN